MVLPIGKYQLRLLKEADTHLEGGQSALREDLRLVSFFVRLFGRIKKSRVNLVHQILKFLAVRILPPESNDNALADQKTAQND